MIAAAENSFHHQCYTHSIEQTKMLRNPIMLKHRCKLFSHQSYTYSIEQTKMLQNPIMLKDTLLHISNFIINYSYSSAFDIIHRNPFISFFIMSMLHLEKN